MSHANLNIRKYFQGATVILGACLFSVASLAETAGNKRIKELVAVEGEGHEAALAELINHELTSNRIGGAFSSYQGSVVSGITPRQIALKVLEKNLSLSLATADNELATQASLEAKAIFDPVMNLNVGISLDESHERTETGTVVAKVFNPIYADPETGDAAPPGEIILPPEAQEASGVEKIIFTNLQADQELRENETIFVSKDNPNGAQTSLELSVGIDQLTPWGVSYDLSLTTVKKDVFYDTSGNSFDAPWASRLLFNLEVPISNDFGENATASLAARQTEIENTRQEWLLKRRINSLLRQATNAYLNLVTSVEQYQIAVENRLLSENQYNATKRNYDSRNATAYELSQIEAQLSLAKSGEQSAAKNYLSASDAVIVLISDQGGALKSKMLVPESYTRWLNTPLEVNESTLRQVAISNRPILQADMLAVAQSELRQRNAMLKTRPDIKLKLSLGLEQNGSVHGYDDVFDSLSNVFSPDNTNLLLSAEYRYPIKNRGLLARSRIADAEAETSQLSLAVSENAVELEVNNALNSLHTSKQTKKQTEALKASAEKSYRAIVKQAKNGSATQNEIVSTLRQLISAKNADITALIGIKRAEADLLAAQGIIDKSFAQWVAKSEFERWRLAQLSQYEDFRFFVR